MKGTHMGSGLIVWLTTVAILIGGIGLVLASGVVLARKAASWKIRRDEDVLAFDEGTITFKRTLESSHPGTFVVHYPNGAAQVGDIVDADMRRVTRKIIRQRGSLAGVRAVRWEGETHFAPDEAGEHSEITIQGPLGPCPAWQFGPDGADTWSIHVHGVRADRHNVVRSVPAAAGAGHTSLVVSYRGDADTTAIRSRAASLGTSEWADVDAAVKHAIAHGAKRVFLFGWSMGASIALLVAERSSVRDRIAGLVLISPASDWRGIIAHGASRRRLPAAAGHLGQLMLSNRRLSQLAGLTTPVNFEDLDWTVPGRLSIPALVIHSPGDRTVPFSITNKFVDAGGDKVTLYTAPDAGHSWEYNVDPEGFDAAIASWLTSLA